MAVAYRGGGPLAMCCAKEWARCGGAWACCKPADAQLIKRTWPCAWQALQSPCELPVLFSSPGLIFQQPLYSFDWFLLYFSSRLSFFCVVEVASKTNHARCEQMWGAACTRRVPAVFLILFCRVARHCIALRATSPLSWPFHLSALFHGPSGVILHGFFRRGVLYLRPREAKKLC